MGPCEEERWTDSTAAGRRARGRGPPTSRQVMEAGAAARRRAHLRRLRRHEAVEADHPERGQRARRVGRSWRRPLAAERRLVEREAAEGQRRAGARLEGLGAAAGPPGERESVWR
jgi:hypothetical protein